MKTPVVNVYVRKDRVPVGLNEDGLRFGDVYSVLAETASGRRWIHRDVQDLDVADRLVVRVRAAGVINTAYWVETYPVYGSKAWEIEDSERHAQLQVAIYQGDQEAIERLS